MPISTSIEAMKLREAEKRKVQPVIAFFTKNALSELPPSTRHSKAELAEMQETAEKILLSPLHEARVDAIHELASKGPLGMKILVKLLSTRGYNTSINKSLEGNYGKPETDLHLKMFGVLSDSLVKHAGNLREKQQYSTEQKEFCENLLAEMLKVTNHLTYESAGRSMKANEDALLKAFTQPDSAFQLAVEEKISSEQNAVWAFDKIHAQREKLLDVSKGETEQEEQEKLKNVAYNAKTILTAAPVSPALATEMFSSLKTRFENIRNRPFSDITTKEIKTLLEQLEKMRGGQLDLFQ